MAKGRKFTITLTGIVPKGMTLAQVRHAYWNGGFGGEGAGYSTVSVDIDDYFDDYRIHRPMKVRLGRIALDKGR